MHLQFKNTFNYLLVSLFISTSLCDKCDFKVNLRHSLYNEGFHRNITYEITFDESNQDPIRNPYRDCLLAVDQFLPKGVYANPDELEDLRRINKIKAYPKSLVNVEVPAELAFTSHVYIVGTIENDHVNLWVPVHARYHRAKSEGGMAKNEIPLPELYLRCPDGRSYTCGSAPMVTFSTLCESGTNDLCDWQSIPFTAMSKTLIWKVPVGNTNHYYLISVGSAIVIALGSFYLVYIIHQYNLGKRKKR